MRQSSKLLGTIAFLAVSSLTACGGASSAAASLAGWRTIAEIPLPGGASRLDYQSLDALHHRLYVAHLGAGTVIAIDVKADRVVGDVADVPGAHGVLAVPERGRVYATATDDNALVTLDPGSLRVTATVSAGNYPDGIAYDPAAARLFISDETGGTVTVVDALSNRRLGSVDLGGEVGNTQYDAATHLVVAAAQGRGELAAIDPVRMAVVRRYPTPGCAGPHGLLISPDGSTAFVACEENARLISVDLSTGAVSTPISVGDTPDVVALDPVLHRLFVAAESGTLTVLDVSGPHPRKVAEGFAGPDAHTVAVDPATHVIYLPLQDVNGQPMLREMVAA